MNPIETARLIAVALLLIWQDGPTHEPQRSSHFVVHYTGYIGTLRTGLNFNPAHVLHPGQSFTLHPRHGDTVMLVLQAPDTAITYINVDDYGLRGVLTYDDHRNKTFTAQ